MYNAGPECGLTAKLGLQGFKNHFRAATYILMLAYIVFALGMAPFMSIQEHGPVSIEHAEET